MLNFLKRYNELWLGPLAVLIWLLSTALFHAVDETAATYDIAVFQKIIFGLIVFNFATFNVWIVMRLTFPEVFKYLTEHFDNDIFNLKTNQTCEKLKISLALFACYLLGLLLAMQVL
jgi:hypothetical protein